MILCDMDGVLATGPGMDTTPGEPIYRTFSEPPEELTHIRAAGIPIHVITAKEEAEAAQILSAIGMDSHIASIIGANRLFWPTVRAAIRRRQLPNALFKSSCRRFLPQCQNRRVVMIENHLEHLHEMLAANTIDFGILVPHIAIENRHIVEWFDLNLALRLARELATGEASAAGLSRHNVAVYRWCEGRPEKVEAECLSVSTQGGSYLLHLPSLLFTNSPSTRGPSLDSLHTGRILMPVRPTVVTTVRAGRRIIRRIVARLSTMIS